MFFFRQWKSPILPVTSSLAKIEMALFKNGKYDQKATQDRKNYYVLKNFSVESYETYYPGYFIS